MNINISLDKKLILQDNIKFNFLIKLTKKYNNYYKNDIIEIDDNITKHDLLKILTNKLNKVDNKFFKDNFFTTEDLIKLIKKYNKYNNDKILIPENVTYKNLLNLLQNKFKTCNDELCLINEVNISKANKKKIEEFKNDENKKCAPHLKYDNGSCYTYEILLDMANTYNTKFRNDKNFNEIILLKDMTKSDLIYELSNRLQNCNNQICWFSKIYENKKNLNLFFRPPGPQTQFKWLNTTNINLVMKQYEKKYNDFKFYGAVPIDFDNPLVSEILFIDYNDLFNNNINRIAFVFNLDRHDQNGSHWVALFCNLKTKLIYFFDSYGTNPFKDNKYENIAILMIRIYNYLDNSLNEKWKKIINKLHTLYDNNNINKCLNEYESNYNMIINSGKLSNDIDFNNFINNDIDINFANIRHQYGNSECGVYSLYFILNMLLDDNNFYKKFYENLSNKNGYVSGKNTNKRINDNLVNQCRDEYFNFTDLLIDNKF